MVNLVKTEAELDEKVKPNRGRGRSRSEDDRRAILSDLISEERRRRLDVFAQR